MTANQSEPHMLFGRWNSLNFSLSPIHLSADHPVMTVQLHSSAFENNFKIIIFEHITSQSVSR